MKDVRFDHRHIYVDDRPVCPTISSVDTSSDALVISLDASPNSLLDWKDAVEKAEEAAGRQQQIVWHLAFHFSSSISQEDPIFHAARKKAVEHFSQEILPSFADSTLFVSFFQGSIDDLHLLEKKKELFVQREETLEFFLQQIQELALSIPENFPISLSFDVREIPVRDLLYHFKRDRFSHILLALRGNSISFPSLSWIEGKGKLGNWDPSLSDKKTTQERIGFVLPPKEKLSEETLSLIEKRFSLSSIRFLYEDFATDEWEELDLLLFLSPLNEKQKRISLGFQAAGGEIQLL